MDAPIRARVQFPFAWCGAAAMAFATAAQGAITSVTGPTWLFASAPASVGPTTPGTQFAYAWDEKQQIIVSSLQVDILGGSGHSNFPAPGLLTALVDSHVLHWETWWIQNGTRTGTVTFNNPIVGVIFKSQTLNLSDAVCKAPQTTYATSPLRGIVPGVEWVKFSGSTLTYMYPTIPGILDYCDVRVLTARVPAPGAALPLLGGALVVARRRR